MLAFSWFTRSRALYLVLKEHLCIPSVTTLSKITRKAKNTEDTELMKLFFANLPERSRLCILIVDEIHVLSSIAYSGGVLHGFAHNQCDQKATAMLGVMVKCLFGGKKFLAKIIPCKGLDSGFQNGVVTNVIDSLKKAHGTLLGIINDNNGVNVKFFKMFTPIRGFPWEVVNPTVRISIMQPALSSSEGVPSSSSPAGVASSSESSSCSLSSSEGVPSSSSPAGVASSSESSSSSLSSSEGVPSSSSPAGVASSSESSSSSLSSSEGVPSSSSPAGVASSSESLSSSEGVPSSSSPAGVASSSSSLSSLEGVPSSSSPAGVASSSESSSSSLSSSEVVESLPSYTSESSAPLFLLYDPVHLMKNIRNNWITEKLKLLDFIDPVSNQKMTAAWKDIADLYEYETTQMLRMSKLTKAAISPSNIEKQSVSLVLKVFCDETASALRLSSKTNDSWQQTATFISLVVRLWKVFNTKSSFSSRRFRDPDRAVIDSCDPMSRGVLVLQMWIDLAESMAPSNRLHRVRALTLETSAALAWTCKCLISITRYLLTTAAPWQHDYVPIGFFQQDDIERHFGHFRMSAGCNFFITVKDVINVHNLDRAKNLLKLSPDLSKTNDRHSCPECVRPLSDSERLILDDIIDSRAIDVMSSDDKMAMVYIGGYVAHKHPDVSGRLEDLPQDTIAYLSDRDRGGLHCPSEPFLNFMFLAFLFFNKVNTPMCRNRLAAVLERFPAIFHLELCLPRKAAVCVSNILLKKYATQQTAIVEESKAKARKRKEHKLSSSAIRVSSSSTDQQ